jgi:hypothetical protein
MKVNAKITDELFYLVGRGRTLEEAFDFYDAICSDFTAFKAAIDASRSLLQSVRRMNPDARIAFSESDDMQIQREHERTAIDSCEDAAASVAKSGLKALSETLRANADSLRAIVAIRESALKVSNNPNVEGFEP